MSSPAAAQPVSNPETEESQVVVAEDADAAEQAGTTGDGEAEELDVGTEEEAAAEKPTEEGQETAPGEAVTDEPSEETSLESQEEGTSSDEEGWMKLEASSAKLEEEPPEPKPYFRTMLLVEGTARYGAVTIAPPGTTLEEEDPGAFESRVGHFGGQATLGVMPGGSAFTMAGRLRGGSYVSTDFTRGTVAADMLFGANFSRNARGNEFTYILGGFGVEFLPGENQDILTLNVGAATVVKGVSFGGGIFVGANDEIAIGTFGMQIGWGQLY